MDHKGLVNCWRQRVRRSVFLRAPVRRGDRLGDAEVDFRRPGDGLDPTLYEALVDARFGRDLGSGHKIVLADLGG